MEKGKNVRKVLYVFLFFVRKLNGVIVALSATHPRLIKTRMDVLTGRDAGAVAVAGPLSRTLSNPVVSIYSIDVTTRLLENSTSGAHLSFPYTRLRGVAEGVLALTVLTT